MFAHKIFTLNLLIKKSMKKISILFIIFCFTLLACETDLKETSPAALTTEVAKVKNWYQSSMGTGPEQKSSASIFGQGREINEPDWGRAVATEVNGRTLVSVPVQLFKNSKVTSESSSAAPAKGGAKVFRSFLISPHGGGFSMAIVSVIPDNPEEVESEGGFVDYFELIENGFNGRMLYAFRNGDFGGGHVFKDGKRVATISGLAQNSGQGASGIPAQRSELIGNIDQGTGCVTQVLTIYERYCHMEMGFEECTEWEPIGTYSLMECEIEYLDPNDNQGPGGDVDPLHLYCKPL